MNEQKTMTQIIASQRVIAFNPIFADVVDDVLAGLMLSQLCYWSERTNRKDGWFYKSQDDWKKEARLSRKNIETARQKLIKLGIISYTLMGVPATGHYKVNYLILEAKIKETYYQNEENYNKNNRLPDSGKQERPIRTNKVVRNGQTRTPDSDKQERPIRTNKVARNEQSITESTQENTQRVNTNTSYSAEKEDATGAATARQEFEQSMQKLLKRSGLGRENSGAGAAQGR